MKDQLENIEQIIEGCKKKDIQAQKKVYILFYPLVKKVIRLYIKDSDLVNDLIQDCFLKAFDKIKTYSGEGTFEGWIRRMASNIAIDHYRKKNKFQTISHDETILEGYTEEDDKTIINLISEHINLDFLEKAIEKLPDNYRLVFIMYVLEQKKHDEIATLLNITTSSSRKRLQHARAFLKGDIIAFCQSQQKNIHVWQ